MVFSKQTVAQFQNVNHTDHTHPNTPKQRKTERERERDHIIKPYKLNFMDGAQGGAWNRASHELENLKLYLTITQVQSQSLHHRSVFGPMLRMQV